VRHLHEAVGAAPAEESRKPNLESRISTTENQSQHLPFSTREFRGREGHQAAVPINFRRQQGMLYLLNQYCTQGGCGRCPLS